MKKEKTRTKRNFLFVLAVLFVCLIIFTGYYLITGKKNPFSGLIDNLQKEDSVKDNMNGIYTYYEELNGSKFIFSGCSFSKIANHILIIENNFYLYRSTCMGTYLKNSGNTKDLDIKLNSESKTYYITYDKKIFHKDDVTNKIEPNNMIADKLKTIELANFKLFMKETQFEGNYYDIREAKLSGISSNIVMNINYDRFSNYFRLEVYDKEFKNVVYNYVIKDFDTMPSFYSYGKDLVVIENERNYYNSELLSYKFKVVNQQGVVYNSDQMFPITIDGVTLTKDNSIYVVFDPSSRLFRMFVGFDDKMCVDSYEENEQNDIMYYEFTINYNYTNKGFDRPKFSKIGRKSERCNYINRFMG